MAPGGYAWWYVDAFSDATGPDGSQYGLTIIGFVGSVFSPYYAWSGRGDPEDHCALNVALYGPRGRRWTMTERGRGAVHRTRDRLDIGPSAMRWEDGVLVIDIAEQAAPIPRRVVGQVRLRPEIGGETAFDLDAAARHRWHPIAPRARIEVTLSEPDLSWSGEAYFDSNFGDEPLEAGFREWNWSRATMRDGAAVLYAGTCRDGERFDLALRCDAGGRWREVEAPPPAALPRTLFAMSRRTRADAGSRARVIATWEDAPFYARTAIATRLFGEEVRAVHESLAMDRFRSPLVLAMLPYRMPRGSPWSVLLGPIAPLIARRAR